jgi:hypothetical protein
MLPCFSLSCRAFPCSLLLLPAVLSSFPLFLGCLGSAPIIIRSLALACPLSADCFLPPACLLPACLLLLVATFSYSFRPLISASHPLYAVLRLSFICRLLSADCFLPPAYLLPACLLLLVATFSYSLRPLISASHPLYAVLRLSFILLLASRSFFSSILMFIIALSTSACLICCLPRFFLPPPGYIDGQPLGTNAGRRFLLYLLDATAGCRLLFHPLVTAGRHLLCSSPSVLVHLSLSPHHFPLYSYPTSYNSIF